MDAPSLTLTIETSTGVYLRPIRPATTLPPDMPLGDAAEQATRDAAARWGLPDFVFHPAQRRRGSATREVGDAILVVGKTAASVQVKAREAEGDEARERSWLDKKIRKATRQAVGTVRSLRSTPETALVNSRGREVLIKGPEKDWLCLVVLDHPGIDGYVPESSAVVLLRRDWEFLFQQLKSTYAVLEYLLRVSGREPVPLGHEPVRYYQLAAADAATPPSPLDPRLTRLLHDSWSAPLLPQPPAGYADYHHHVFLRALLEDIATTPVRTEGMQHADVLAVLAAIDAAPVAYRAELGRTILGWLRELSEAPASGDITWRFRNHLWPDRPYLLFGATNRQHDSLVQEAFNTFVALRHQQHLDLMPERGAMMTVGILLTPRRDGRRPWDTTTAATSGQQEFDQADRVALEVLWGRLGDNHPSSTPSPFTSA